MTGRPGEYSYEAAKAEAAAAADPAPEPEEAPEPEPAAEVPAVKAPPFPKAAKGG